MSQPLLHLHERKLESATFDMETKEWVFLFSGRAALQVSAPWRVIADGRIALGWQDDGQWFGLSAPLDAGERLDVLLTGRRVETATLSVCGDLVIQFEGGPTLDIFNASCGYEGWQINGPDNRCVVAQGGGTVVESQRDG